MKSLAAATTAAALLASPAAAADLTLKFGHVGAPGSLFEASVDAFAACANESLAGKAEVQTFGSSQLGKDRELLQKLKLNQVTFALPSSVMSSVDDTFGVFEMPYIIKDREHMKRVQEALGDTFQAAAQENGYLKLWTLSAKVATDYRPPDHGLSSQIKGYYGLLDGRPSYASFINCSTN
ncbi:MAG: TRAP transporter substrate-binding protein DctP, partial [Pseudomonadota bacterium]